MEENKMTIPTIVNPVTDADFIFNTIVQNCEFYKDQNEEQFMVAYTPTGYTLVYLSSFDDSNIFFRVFITIHAVRLQRKAIS